MRLYLKAIFLLILMTNLSNAQDNPLMRYFPIKENAYWRYDYKLYNNFGETHDRKDMMRIIGFQNQPKEADIVFVVKGNIFPGENFQITPHGIYSGENLILKYPVEKDHYNIELADGWIFSQEFSSDLPDDMANIVEVVPQPIKKKIEVAGGFIATKAIKRTLLLGSVMQSTIYTVFAENLGPIFRGGDLENISAGTSMRWGQIITGAGISMPTQKKRN